MKLTQLLLSELLPTLCIAQQSFKTAPVELANIRCGDSNKLPTPSFGDKSIAFTVCAEQDIDAPLQLVYDSILDFSKYSLWNSFVIDVQPISPPVLPQGPAPIDTKVSFVTSGLLGPLNTTSTEIVTVDTRDLLGDGTKAVSAWKFGLRLAPAEHPNVLTDLGAGRTRYVSWETFYAPAGFLTVALRRNLQRQFDNQGRDLKVYTEGLARM